MTEKEERDAKRGNDRHKTLFAFYQNRTHAVTAQDIAESHKVHRNIFNLFCEWNEIKKKIHCLVWSYRAMTKPDFAGWWLMISREFFLSLSFSFSAELYLFIHFSSDLLLHCRPATLAHSRNRHSTRDRHFISFVVQDTIVFRVDFFLILHQISNLSLNAATFII